MNSEPSSFEDLIERLQKIKDMGYVETHRRGNTGIGKTLEDLLGIKENNVPSPNAVGIELKSTRRESNNLNTLFTKEPPRDKRDIWNQDLVKELGYVDSKGREALKVTIEVDDPNNQGFYLSYDDDTVYVNHEDYGTCAEYPISLLRETFTQKLPALLLIIADVKKQDGKEHFWYNEGYLLSDFDADEFLKLMRESIITLDLRMHVKESGNIRNRGTAWRILNEAHLERAYSNKLEVFDDEMDASEIERRGQMDLKYFVEKEE